MVYEMIERERVEFKVTNKVNFGILAEDSKCGPSMDILALMANNKRVVLHDVNEINKLLVCPEFGFHGFEFNVVNTNLIIIPDENIYSWLRNLSSNTTLDHY